MQSMLHGLGSGERKRILSIGIAVPVYAASSMRER